MTDRTLEITTALREAHLQQLEASLASKAAKKPAGTNETTSFLETTADKAPAIGH
ncbi:hypothetical protein KR52_14250 [Synechococcus sp. KORDI-52]|uniref:hypothetical protein n=1 Tax=Synechococcus sp. KORDI-52 TaxID=585425 RepID=UPI0004E08DFB|nr:hypothetical protein [Synechococcus sp. KORDI-52]AII50283.1 hypothetical protein KR52_14250 [Synechococcus sp. KORDI-52]